MISLPDYPPDDLVLLKQLLLEKLNRQEESAQSYQTHIVNLKEPDRHATSQSWILVQAGGPPDRKVILFNYTSSRAQEVPLRLLEVTVAVS